MNSFAISSKKHGKVRFRLCGTYIYVAWSENGGGQQICAAGGLNGNTLQGKPETYERISRRWFRNYCRKMATAE
jgi:hypothetical protein